MVKVTPALILMSMICFPQAGFSLTPTKPMPDYEIKRNIIDGTLSRYELGTCPCPYSVNLDGKACGNNSIYIRNLGANKPRCYPDDVTEFDLYQFQSQHLVPPEPKATPPANTFN